MSFKVRDLGKEALDIEEDRMQAGIVEKRMASLDRKATKSHVEIWSTPKRSKR